MLGAMRKIVSKRTCPLAICAVLLLTFFGARHASAQETTADTQTMRPALDRDGYLGMQGTAMPGPWQFNVGLWVGYERSPVVLRSEMGDEVTRTDVIGHRTSATLQMQIGIWERFALAAELPLVLHQSGDADLPGGPARLESTAMGDPRLTFRARILGRAATAQRVRSEGPGLAVQAGLTLPAGSLLSLSGEGAPTFDVQVIGDFHIFGLGGGAMLGWRHRFDNQQLPGVELRDRLMYGLAVKVPIPVGQDFQGIIELRGDLDAADPFGVAERTTMELGMGLSFSVGSVNFLSGFGLGLIRGVGTPRARAFFAARWAPRTPDSDGDGVEDDEDPCPHLPEDFDGFEDDDGCADPDNDGDFVPDLDDRCPEDEAMEDFDEDEDGCTDEGAPTPEEYEAQLEEIRRQREASEREGTPDASAEGAHEDAPGEEAASENEVNEATHTETDGPVEATEAAAHSGETPVSADGGEIPAPETEAESAQ